MIYHLVDTLVETENEVIYAYRWKIIVSKGTQHDGTIILEIEKEEQARVLFILHGNMLCGLMVIQKL